MIRQPRRWPGYAAAAIGLVFVKKYRIAMAGLIKGLVHFVEWSAARAVPASGPQLVWPGR
jgi:hypothetical protein